MPILSIDLACRHHRDIGIALLDRDTQCARARFLDAALPGTPDPDVLAEYISNLAGELGATLLLIDGPQGWKSPGNELPHSRVCERRLNTPAKTGLPGNVKPAAYGHFVQFSVAFFDGLERRGWPRLREPGRTSGVAIETFPHAAWRSLGLQSLPAKSKTTPSILQDRRNALLSVFPTRLDAEPNHDQLQALVAGYAGLAMARGDTQGFALAGEAPFLLDGAFREGFIATPLRGRMAINPQAGHAADPKDETIPAIHEIPPADAPLALLLLADPSERKVRAYLPGARCFAARMDGAIAGICAVMPLAQGSHELMNIAVDPARQQRGIGTRLLAHVIDTYRREGAQRLEVGTGTFGYPLAFYQRQGLRAFQVDRDFFLRNYDEAIVEDGIQHRDMLRLALDYRQER